MQKGLRLTQLQERLKQRQDEELTQIEAILKERNEKLLTLLNKEYGNALRTIREDTQALRQKSWMIPASATLIALAGGLVLGWLLAPKQPDPNEWRIQESPQGRFLILPKGSQTGWECEGSECVRLPN